MKINKSMLFPLFICVIVWNVFLLTSSRFSGDKRIEKETRSIYNSIIIEVNSLSGRFEQFGGRVLDGFVLVIFFPELNIDYTNSLFSKIKDMGFVETSENLKYGSYLFCKGKSGFLVSVDKELTIDYRYNMSYCSKIR